ncbi:hypothetical protein DAI22_06g022400 [Oryza sativa Japonica Group]|nr:hypothetical protein DAI22_06g022400 [Oryza sativa Japonica Group]
MRRGIRHRMAGAEPTDVHGFGEKYACCAEPLARIVLLCRHLVNFTEIASANMYMCI